MSDFTCPSCGQTCKVIPLRTLESVSSTFSEGSLSGAVARPKRGQFWYSEGFVNFVAVVTSAGVVWLYCRAYDFNAWPSAFVGVLVGVGLPVLRVVLHRPAAPAQPVQKSVISVKQVSDDGRHWVLRDFNESISLEDLQDVARAVLNWGEWSRKVTTKKAHLSQVKHNKLQDDLLKLWYLEPLPNGANGYAVTRQGRRFFESVTSIPQS